MSWNAPQPGHSCHACGGWIPEGTFHSCSINPSYQPRVWPPAIRTPIVQGWECPKCHAVMAPAMVVCPYCAPRKASVSTTTASEDKHES